MGTCCPQDSFSSRDFTCFPVNQLHFLYGIPAWGLSRDPLHFLASWLAAWFVAAENIVVVAGREVIATIVERSPDESQLIYKAPSRRKVPGNFEYCLAACPVHAMLKAQGCTGFPVNARSRDPLLSNGIGFHESPLNSW
jgi:hypothetical protein